MNKTQALKEAQKRWGKSAIVSYNPKAPTEAEKATMPPRDVRRLQHRCDVGHAALGLFFNILGSGDTFEEAFASAKKGTTFGLGKMP